MKVIDAVTNFAQTFLVGSIGLGDTSLTVSPGTGSKFPVPSGPLAGFNFTIFDAIYSNPALDPNVEICRCTGNPSGDSFNPILRGQGGTTAKPHNTPGHTYRIIHGPDMDTIKQISNAVLPTVKWFGAVGDGVTDDRAAFQAAFDNTDSVYIPQSAGNYIISGQITMTGTKYIFSNGATIQTTIAAPATAVFANASISASLLLHVERLNFSGPSSIFDMQLVGSQPAAGLSLYCNEVNVNAGSYTASANFLTARQMDFMMVSKCRIQNMDKVFNIQSNNGAGERDNTQIYAEDIYIANCNEAGRFAYLDKATFKGVDIATCGAGFIFSLANKRVMLDGCHVEGFGTTGFGSTKAGYAYYIEDASAQDGIEMERCSAFVQSATNAVAALYLGTQSSNKQQLRCTDCSFDVSSGSSPSYLAIKSFAQLTWTGAWPFTGSQVLMTTHSTNWADNLIRDDKGGSAARLGNLLPACKIPMMTGTTGATSIVADTDGIVQDGYLISITGNPSNRYKTINLKVGWHTLVFSGYPKSGTVYAYVQQNSGSFDTYLEMQFNGSATKEQVYRHIFYNPTAQTVRVGFGAFSAGASTAVIGSVELFYGFAVDFATDTMLPRNNTTATTDPAVTDDSLLGYKPGSVWVNTSTPAVYTLTDSTAGAAVWKRSWPTMEVDLSFTDITTANVTSTKHGLTPKSPADATQFLNGAATPAWALVKDSDLSTSDITTNNVTSTKHGFAPKAPADGTKFLNGLATPAWAFVKDSDLALTDITTNNVSTSAHGFAPKAPNDVSQVLIGDGSWNQGSPFCNNPLKGWQIWADFGGNTGSLGDAMLSNVSGTGAATAIDQITATNQFGRGRINCGTTNTGRASWETSMLVLAIGAGPVYWSIKDLKLGSLSTATDTYTWRAGFLSGTASEPTDGIYFRYTDGATGAHFRAVTRSGGVETDTDTGVVADTNNHKFEITVNAAGTSVIFKIDGSTVATVTTNIPTGTGHAVGMSPMSIVKSVGTTNVNIFCDYVWAHGEWTTPRT